MSTVFNIPVEFKPKKEVTTHPWANTIKDYYTNLIKLAHNSVNNVVYPRPKEKKPFPKRVTFTVIGDRVTKEFIYCVKLVQGIHKYRWKNYGAPIIRGCTSVEWGDIFQNLKSQFGSLLHGCVKGRSIVLCNNRFIGGEEELRRMIETQYVYHLALNYQKESEAFFANYLKSSGRQCACLHISIDGEIIGCLIFMLYTDVVPRTCENFLRLCKARRGGYSGTPVHRVLKDGWIQCGGYGLKNNEDMDCENFIVPHDKRGVLGMANDGRHEDCSTQFYVLLQPNDIMRNRFVAFGQLIDGEETLKKIENVETYYEAPTAFITIFKAEILNLDCKDIRINKSTREYLDGHLDDLVSIGEFFYELILSTTFLEIEFRELQTLKSPDAEIEEESNEAFRVTMDEMGNLNKNNMGATRKFIRKKTKKSIALSDITEDSNERKDLDEENKDFGVESYEYHEEEEEEEEKEPAKESVSVLKAKKPYVIAFTDVPYPGEVDSSFDLKRMLQGDYCLKSDLNPKQSKLEKVKTQREEKINALSIIISGYCSNIDSDESLSLEDLSSDEEKDIRDYLSANAEKVSFSGTKTRAIAKCILKTNPIDQVKSKEHFNDEDLRMMRMALMDFKNRDNRKVSLKAQPWQLQKGPIPRQQTGFVRHMEGANVFVDENETEGKKSEADDDKDQSKTYKLGAGQDEMELNKEREKQGKKSLIWQPVNQEETYERRSSIRHSFIAHSQSAMRQSAIRRLFDDVTINDGDKPTLKDYKPHEVGKKAEITLAMSDAELREDTILHKPNQRLATLLQNGDDDRSKQVRKSNLKIHGTAWYAKCDESTEFMPRKKNYELELPSVRCTEWKRYRPSMTVKEYQMMNERKKAELRTLKELQ